MAKAEEIGGINGSSVSIQHLVWVFRKCTKGFLSFPRRFCKGFFSKVKRLHFLLLFMSSHVNMPDLCNLLELLCHICEGAAGFCGAVKGLPLSACKLDPVFLVQSHLIYIFLKQGKGQTC